MARNPKSSFLFAVSLIAVLGVNHAARAEQPASTVKHRVWVDRNVYLARAGMGVTISGLVLGSVGLAVGLTAPRHCGSASTTGDSPSPSYAPSINIGGSSCGLGP